jgi:hypothetical protein
MDYKEHMIIEKWKDVSTEEVLKTKKDAKMLLLMTNENYMLILSFLFCMSPVIVLFLVGAFILAKILLLPFFILHFCVWFFYVRKNFINKYTREAASIINSEADVVLKNRKN